MHLELTGGRGGGQQREAHRRHQDARTEGDGAIAARPHLPGDHSPQSLRGHRRDHASRSATSGIPRSDEKHLCRAAVPRPTGDQSSARAAAGAVCEACHAGTMSTAPTRTRPITAARIAAGATSSADPARIAANPRPTTPPATAPTTPTTIPSVNARRNNVAGCQPVAASTACSPARSRRFTARTSATLNAPSSNASTAATRSTPRTCTLTTSPNAVPATWP